MPSLPSRPGIPLFDRTLRHSVVSTEMVANAAGSSGPGRPTGRRVSAAPWTGVKMAARWRMVGVAVPEMVLVVALVITTSLLAMAQTALPVAPLENLSITEQVAGVIVEAARRFNVPATWVRAVMRAESGGNERAVSPKGAMGLMQIMPETWSELRARYGLGTDPFDVRDNVLAGTAYLRELHDRYGMPAFLAAYQAGPGRYDEYLAKGRPLPDETLVYVEALVPILEGRQGDGDVGPIAMPSWRESPLFAVQRTRAPSGFSSSAKSQPERSPSPLTVVGIKQLSPQSADLFAPMASQGRRP
jgi:soluble lytic murein transglycosylase-like protein